MNKLKTLCIAKLKFTMSSNLPSVSYNVPYAVKIQDDPLYSTSHHCPAAVKVFKGPVPTLMLNAPVQFAVLTILTLSPIITFVVLNMTERKAVIGVLKIIVFSKPNAHV